MTRGSLLSATASVLVAAVLLPAAPASAAPAYPKPDGRCVDRTAVLGAALCDRITKVLLSDEKDSRDEIAVAVVPTTGDASIESWSTGLFNAWGVGKAGEDNGVLLVVAVDDRRVRLEAGRGLSARLPDSTAKEIVDTAVTPRFAAQEYRAGILGGLDEVRRRLGHPLDERLTALAPRGTTAATTPAAATPVGAAPAAAAVGGPDPTVDLDSDDDGLGAPGWLLVAIIVIAFGVLVTTVRTADPSSRSGSARRRRQHHHGSSSFFYGGGDSGSSWGGGGDSGSSFGGGSSDGGGSSGSW